MNRPRTLPAAQTAGQLKAQQRSHAVAEQGIRYIQIRLKNLRGLLDGF
jgi:hypothetical protein